MKKLIFGLFLSSLLVSSTVSADNLVLWYQQPASEWTDALAIGNGRLRMRITVSGSRGSRQPAT